jgi:integrase
MAITDTWLKANIDKVVDKPFERADRDGLSVRVTTKGAIKFQMRYRVNGRAARIDIGAYPVISLKEARTACDDYRRQLHDGIDPRDAIKQKKLSEDDGTIESIFRSWHKSQFSDGRSSVKERTALDYIKALELHVFPKIGTKQAEKVTLHQWLDLLEALAAKKPTTTNLVLTVCRRALKWAVRRRMLSTNELASVESKEDLNITKRARVRTLTDDELTGILLAFENANRQALSTRLMLFLALFFGCRIGELRLAKIADFDFDKQVWTVPVANHKMGVKTGKALVRPIISEVMPVIKLVIDIVQQDAPKCEYIFPKKNLKPYSKTDVSAMSRPVNTWLKANNRPIDGWTIHDLRRTQRTNMSRITTTEVAETMLGHKLPGIQSVYDHHDYLEEQAKAYQIWWHKLQRLKDPSTYQNVVELKKAQ